MPVEQFIEEAMRTSPAITHFGLAGGRNSLGELEWAACIRSPGLPDMMIVSRSPTTAVTRAYAAYASTTFMR